jgi:DNA adenine methylase
MDIDESMTTPCGETQLEFGEGFLSVRCPDTGTTARVRIAFASIRARPFLKWAGGKQWLAPIASALVPPDFAGRYFEPFLGGGALFFALQPALAVLSDLNSELIATYAALRDEVDPLIDELSGYPHDRDFFFDLRARRPASPVLAGARLIYLNKTAFNGMYRVNAKGEFNVPFGSYRRPTICQEERLRDAADALSAVDLRCADFSDAIAAARADDFVFFDPPYVTGHHNNGFRKYNAQLFSWECQERLKDVISHLTERKVRVAMTNADHPALRSLFDGLHVTVVKRRSLINSSAASRGLVREALYTNFPVSAHSLICAAEGRS